MDELDRALGEFVKGAEEIQRAINDYDRDLNEAVELLEAAISLRMYGDISHQKMSQHEWDRKAAEFLLRIRQIEEESANE